MSPKLVLQARDHNTAIEVDDGPVLKVVDGHGRETVILLPSGEVGDGILIKLHEELTAYLYEG